MPTVGLDREGQGGDRDDSDAGDQDGVVELVVMEQPPAHPVGGLGRQLRLLVGSDGVRGLESAAGLLGPPDDPPGLPCLSGTVDEHVSRRCTTGLGRLPGLAEMGTDHVLGGLGHPGDRRTRR